MNIQSTNKDAPIKVASMEMLWSLGYVVRPEFLLSEQRFSTTSRRGVYLDLTDIDVIGYAFDPLLNVDTVAVDCGSGQKRAVMERVFWARGVMDATKLKKMICVVGRDADEEHRRAAEKLNVVLLPSKELSQFSEGLVGRNSMYDLSAYYEANTEWLAYLATTQSPFGDFLLKENWSREWDRLPVTLPGQLKRWNVRLLADKEPHAFTFLEVAILLAISLIKMCAGLAMVRPNDFSGAVQSYVLGGGRRRKFVTDLAKQISGIGNSANVDNLFESNQSKDSPESLIPHLPDLLDVANRLVTRIGSARAVPRYIQAFQLARIKTRIEDYPEFLGTEPDPLVTKLALDVLRYLRIAAEVAPEFGQVFANV